MIKKQNDLLLKILIAGVAVLIIVAAVLLFSDCGNDDDQWLSSSGSEVSSGDAAEENMLDGVYAAPDFKNGVYTMVSSVVNKEEYTDGAGQPMYSYSSATRYTYRMEITRYSNAINCIFTFEDIYGSSTENGATTVQLDTANPDMYSEELSMFYDLLGKSFSIVADLRGNITEIRGVDELLAACPNSAALVDEAVLLGVAADIFHEIPATFSAGTSWQLNQYGLANTYTVNRLERGRFGVDILGEQPDLPDPITDTAGYTTAYSSITPLTGTMWIDQFDRAVQELSSYQRSTGTFADKDGYGTYFTITASTNCTVTPAA